MKIHVAVLFALALATVQPVLGTEGPQRLAQAPAAGDVVADTAAARALLDSWKGEAEILDQARRKLESAWAADRTNAEMLKEMSRYVALRKQMQEIQRKTRGGPGVAEARKILDAWSGQPDVLARAQQALDRVVAEDAYNAYVPIEAARLEMMRGYRNNRKVWNGRIVYVVGNYAPQTLFQATRILHRASNYDPLMADHLVMQAYISFQNTGLDAAEKSLQLAESKGATDPRRHFYWADILAARGNYAAAVERVQRGLQEGAGDAKMAIMGHARLADIHMNTGESAKAIASHEAMLKLEPQNPWHRNNFSNYLSESLGRNDQAIAEARAALKIMDFGIGRTVLAKALYGKWADLVAERKADAEAYFEEARRLQPDLDDTMVYGASRPTGERLAKALIAKRVSINARADDGSTALLIATNLRRNQTVKFLLSLNADPNLPDKNGWTPLLSAASDGNTEAVDLILAKGGDIRATLQGKDAAALAAENGHPELAASLKKRM